jgi:hypothetical protein
MKYYEFKITIGGYGNTPQEAWADAINGVYNNIVMDEFEMADSAEDIQEMISDVFTVEEVGEEEQDAQ